MHKLILKDVLIQKRVLPYLILYIPFITFITGKLDSSGLYVIISLTIAFMLSSNSFALEEVSQSSKVILSLPVTRREVVLSKYLSIFVYIAVSIALTSAAGAISTFFLGDSSRLKYINLSEIIRIAVSCTIVCCIVFPLQFRLGYAKARVATIMVYIMLFSVVPILMDQMRNFSLKEIIILPELLKGASGGCFTAALLGVIWLASYFMSTNFYEKREI